MSAYLLPKSLCDEIQRMLNSYWWGTNGKGIRWLSWGRIAISKEDKGLNFLNLHALDWAMLGKQGWKFVSNPNALVSKFFKAKYFFRGDFIGLTLGHKPSFIWQSIC